MLQTRRSQSTWLHCQHQNLKQPHRASLALQGKSRATLTSPSQLPQNKQFFVLLQTQDRLIPTHTCSLCSAISHPIFALYLNYIFITKHFKQKSRKNNAIEQVPTTQQHIINSLTFAIFALSLIYHPFIFLPILLNHLKMNFRYVTPKYFTIHIEKGHSATEPHYFTPRKINDNFLLIFNPFI